jgi:ribosome-binding protein aMBF1 (putative translation factor)
MNHAQTIKLGSKEYVILPKGEYLRLRDIAGVPAGSVDAVEYARASIGGTLRAAREHAGLTQAELARALKKSQPMVSGAESGSISVSARYVAAVLKACHLPEDWVGPGAAKGKRSRRSKTRKP